MSLLAPDRAPTAGPPVPPSAAPAAGRRHWWAGPAGGPAWARPALLGLLLGTAVLYLWGLGAARRRSPRGSPPTFAATTVGGIPVYDLTAPTS